MYTEEYLKLRYQARREHLSEQLAYGDIDRCEFEDAILELSDQLEYDLNEVKCSESQLYVSLQQSINRYNQKYS